MVGSFENWGELQNYWVFKTGWQMWQFFLAKIKISDQQRFSPYTYIYIFTGVWLYTFSWTVTMKDQRKMCNQCTLEDEESIKELLFCSSYSVECHYSRSAVFIWQSIVSKCILMLVWFLFNKYSAYVACARELRSQFLFILLLLATESAFLGCTNALCWVGMV